MPVSVHIGEDFARVCGVTLPARPSARGLELGSEALLRPISFGLRSRLVAWAGDNLAEALLAEMLSGEANGVHPLAVQALALHLAGAESGAPGFVTTTALVARLFGWPLAEINASEALEIDRLAASLAGSMEKADDGDWTTVEFAASGRSTGEDESLEDLCSRLAADLRGRGTATIFPDEAALLSVAPPVARASGEQENPLGPGADAGTGYPVSAFGADQPTSATVDPPLDFGTSEAPPGQPTTAFGEASMRPATAETFDQPRAAREPDPSVRAGPEAASGATDTRSGSQAPGQAAAAVDSEPPLHGAARAAALAAEPLRPPRREDGLPTYRWSPSTPSEAANAPAPFPGNGGSSRASLLHQAVAATGPARPPAEAFRSLTSALLSASAPFRGAVASDPSSELDSIADALHAIADLRGVAR